MGVTISAFASILSDCTQITNYHDCGTDGTFGKLRCRRSAVCRNVTTTLNAITNVMRKNGYADGSYKFVYQSGPDLLYVWGAVPLIEPLHQLQGEPGRNHE